jgi:hypothetical protein
MSFELAVPVPTPSHILPTGEIAEPLCLKLAGQYFSIEGIPDGWQDLLPPRLNACMTRQVAASNRMIKMQMSSSEHLRPPSEPHDLNQTSHLICSASQVKFKSDWCEGNFNIALDTPVRLQVHVEASPWFGDVLENLLRVLVAYDILHRGGVMLHCAAIVKNQQAVVMFGHSGTGKSTISAHALENNCSVISDDINIIEPNGDGWQVRPVPFSGTLNALSDIVHPVPLRGLFRLNQADVDRLGFCSQARAVSLLAGSAPFVNRDIHRSAQLFDILSDIPKKVGVQDLYFTHSDQFLQHVF